MLEGDELWPEMSSEEFITHFGSDKFWDGSVEEVQRRIQDTLDFIPESDAELDKGSDSEGISEITLTSEMDILDDVPESNVDLLDRGPFAIGVAREIHRLWMRNNLSLIHI